MGHRRRVHAPQHRQPTHQKRSHRTRRIRFGTCPWKRHQRPRSPPIRRATSPHGPTVTDFQTMGRRADGKPNPLETKEYLQDSTFTVGLESNNLRLLRTIGAAIQHPVYMPYLGRRACPPAGPIRVGLVDKPLEQAFKGKEQAHVETIDGTEAHWDQPANNRVKS